MMEITPAQTIELDYSKTREQRILEGMAAWASFYRENPHRFVKDYLNVNLKPFQQTLLMEMDRNNYTAYIASRGQGKSFVAAVYSSTRCILYPGTKICIAAGRRSQSINILEYIQNQLIPNSPNLKNEIKSIQISNQKAEVLFHNGSFIKVVTASDSSRGSRAHIILLDEFRMINEEIVNTVIKKFTSDERHPPFVDNPQYKHLRERNKQIYLTSAWFKDHWSYKKVTDFYDRMTENKAYFVCGLPYQLSIKEGLYNAEQAADEMAESTFNEAQWRREMECEWTGDTEGSFFNYEAINRNRKIKYPLVPFSMSSRFGGKNMTIPRKIKDEIRIISADIALMRSSKKVENDATSIFVNQMVPNARGRFYNNIVYAEAHEGETTQRQALRLRRLYEEYEADYIVIDGKGVGAGIVDLLLDDVYDTDTGETYDALSCYNNSELAARCTNMDAKKALYVINNQTARFNSECAFLLREGFRSGKIRLLMTEYEAEDILSDLKGWGGLNPVEKTNFRLPYLNTTMLVDELINLKYEDTANGVKVYEKSGFRKDRYSSLSYNYWVASQMEDQYRKRRKGDIDLSAIFKCQRQPKIM